MMGRQAEPGQLFYKFNLEHHIPPDHLLRRINVVLDLSAIRRALAPYYATGGRPSVDPELSRIAVEWIVEQLGIGV